MCAGVCMLGRVRGGHVHGPGIDERVKTDFLLRFFGASRESDQCIKSPQ